MTPLEALVAAIIVREGGVKDVGDGKGVTRYGQTPDWLARFNLPSPTSPEEAAGNYEKWIAIVGLTPVVQQGDGLADIVLDMAVMSGERQAIKSLQGALGVTADGALGPQTLAALFTANRAKLAREVIARDMEFQGRLIEMNAHDAVFAAGWAKRMAGHVRRLA